MMSSALTSTSTSRSSLSVSGNTHASRVRSTSTSRRVTTTIRASSQQSSSPPAVPSSSRRSALLSALVATTPFFLSMNKPALAGMDSFRPSAKPETASSQEAYVEELLKSSKGISGIEASPNKGIKGEAERKTNRMVAPPQNKSEEEKAKEAKEASKKPAAAA